MTQESRKAETHERLLEAAADLFARFGFDGTSTDALAEAAGRTSGALYAHFGSKEGLLLALLSRWESETTESMRRALETEADIDGRVRAVWSTLTGSSSDPDDETSSSTGSGPDGLLLEHELWLYAARHPELATQVALRYSKARAATAESIRTWGSETGAASDMDASTSATLIMALLLGLDMQRRLDPSTVSTDAALTGLRLLLGERSGDGSSRQPHGDREVHQDASQD